MTAFIIEHQCPQCGAPAELEESDRLFRCGYCRVSSYLTTRGTFRYALPHQAPPDSELIYFPYWRFKGMLFSCLPNSIEHRVVDVSHQAIASPHFPPSVGFRSQTQKIRFAGGLAGRFLKPEINLAAFLASVDERFTGNLPKPILHHAQIGETVSLLYAPLYVREKVIDAVLNEPLARGDARSIAPMLERSEKPFWPITFVPSLCPHCGWNLDGQRDSLVLSCTNCRSLWWPKQGKLQELKAAHVPGGDPNTLYIPFWRIQADVDGLELETQADLIRVANLPRVVQPGWERLPFYFWSPAFKVRPQVLLNQSTAFTVNQPTARPAAGPPQGRLLDVNMPFAEALQSLKLILAGLIRPKERMVAAIADLSVTARRFLLVYLPFREDHHEYIHDGLRLAINKNLLSHSRNL